MLEAAVVALRLAQYAGAMVLMGLSLFIIYAMPPGRAAAAQVAWSRTLLIFAASLLAAAALLGIAAQSCVLAGSVLEGLKPETLAAVVTDMDLGKAAIARAVAAGIAIVLLLALRPGRKSSIIAAIAGTVATGSFAWMGHGAATEGPGNTVHLTADILHAWAAAVWLGALAAFFLLLRMRNPSREAVVALHRALHGFSGAGTVSVALLVATGLVNSWFLVGPRRLEALWTTPYGGLLSVKLSLVTGMLFMAAANRFRLTPALARALEGEPATKAALASLRRSVSIETGLGLGVLALVAWFGTLAPPSAM